ncbi:MAG TPA: hypothetical protein VFN35_11465 [Ktedonobacteraceae bacterium]|nr:hypothetical protein [Ktedonobacteraceae bacterium]
MRRRQQFETNALAWSPDGTYVAAGTYVKNKRVIQVWKVTAAEVTFAYEGHTRDILALAWSPDGKSIASGGQNREVHVWEPC